MITINKELHIEPRFDFTLLAPKERIVFFDIETTGLRAGKASIYLIGTVSWEGGQWILRQFFAENLFEEEEVLAAFFSLLNEKKRLGRVFLVSYNGDGFDIPFIRSCIQQYHLPYEFTGTYSIDLLKKVRPVKGLLGLDDCRLKTVERFCGVCREDRYSGGELIYVYEEYMRLKSLDPESCESTPLNTRLRDRLLETLLLHNAEDIMDMPLIMDVMGYDYLRSGEYVVTSSRITEDNVWDIHARLCTAVPRGIYSETPAYTLSIGEEDPLELNLAVPVYDGELKYFFVDYKNYYYLPAEDYAIHKSVGSYVDRAARRQATARTCYQKKRGRFVPQPAPVFTPLFYQEYKGVPYGELPKPAGSAAGTDTEKEGTGQTWTEETEIDHALTKKYIAAVIENI
ncbi:MAG: ribonuclease H-like domain-containing protein [Lachnospiraceae bacterium]|nr:ribonuclease H-like domain-containing protein [Lachnospiraceae bacterium]